MHLLSNKSNHAHYLICWWNWLRLTVNIGAECNCHRLVSNNQHFMWNCTYNIDEPFLMVFLPWHEVYMAFDQCKEEMKWSNEMVYNCSAVLSLTVYLTWLSTMTCPLLINIMFCDWCYFEPDIDLNQLFFNIATMKQYLLQPQNPVSYLWTNCHHHEHK